MFVFVIMPFRDKLTEIYNDIVKPTLEAEGCTVQRADELSSHRNILKDIVSGIFTADLIVADLTDTNSNVYYELGIAHGLNKPTILLTQNIDDLPFDLASYRAVPYSDSYKETEKLKAILREAVQGHKNRQIEFGNPVSDYLQELVSPTSQSGNEEVNIPSLSIEEYAGDANTSLYELIHGSVRQSNLLSGLTSDFLTYTKMVELANATRNWDLFHQTNLGVARSLEKFGAEVSKELPSLRGNWETLKNSYVIILTAAQIEDGDDLQPLKTVKGQLADLAETIDSLIPSLKAHSASLENIKSINQALRQQVDVTLAVLDELYEIYLIGRAYLARIINLLERKFSV